MMYHPMHVHGHTFALVPPAGPGIRKDTVIVPPMSTVSIDLVRRRGPRPRRHRLGRNPARTSSPRSLDEQSGWILAAGPQPMA